MKVVSCFVLAVILSVPLPNKAYRILGVFPYNGASHFVMFERVMKELATRGHRVDVISHYPRKTPFPNYTDVVSLAGTISYSKNNMTYEFATNALQGGSIVTTIATRLGHELCDLMDVPQFREFIRNPPKDPPYDLLMVQIFGFPCYLALGQHLKVPIVGVATSPLWPWANDMVENPENPAYIPHIFSGLSGKMDFWQRLKNTLTLHIAKWQYSYYSSAQDDQIKKYIGPHAPSLKDAEKDLSLILVNSHYSVNGVRPFTTAVVEVGGLHIKEDESPLPAELQKWLDDSTSGFVYISFGSMLKIETYPKEILSAIYSSLKKIAPIRFLIKVTNKNELPPGLPNNVLTLPWIPQTGVLQHRNIRAFVTHGGLLGTQEAIYYGVPMIGVPLFGDQAQNIEILERNKVAVGLNLNQLTEERLDAAFKAVLHDPIYQKSARKLSVEFRDRPMSPVDTMIFWVEYVIRHGGTNIRSPAVDLTWWQIALLDVYGALLAAAAFTVYLLKVLICKAKRSISKNDTKKPSNTEKNE